MAAPGPGYDRFLADIKANADINELLYRSANSKDDVKKAFDDFIVHPVIAEEFVPFGSLGSSFSLINYPGEPRYRASEGTSVEWSGSSFKWYIGTKNAAGIYEVPAADDGVFRLSFYIKLSDAAIKAGGFHAVFNQLGVTYVQYPDGNVLNKNQTTKTYPNVYISSGGEVKEGVTGASDGENANQTTAEVEMTKNTDIETLFSKTEGEKKTESAAMSSVSSPNTSEKPEITKISFGLTPEGKNQVTVSVKNGSSMLFQWQKKEGDNWVDILGANGSVYTLGKGFKVGQKYELRCIISNRANQKFYSDSLIVTPEKSAMQNETLKQGSK